MYFRGRNSVVECSLPKADVEGSNPFARFSANRLDSVFPGVSHSGT